jgi:hypothetical protein
MNNRSERKCSGTTLPLSSGSVDGRQDNVAAAVTVSSPNTTDSRSPPIRDDVHQSSTKFDACNSSSDELGSPVFMCNALGIVVPPSMPQEDIDSALLDSLSTGDDYDDESLQIPNTSNQIENRQDGKKGISTSETEGRDDQGFDGSHAEPERKRLKQSASSDDGHIRRVKSNVSDLTCDSLTGEGVNTCGPPSSSGDPDESIQGSQDSFRIQPPQHKPTSKGNDKGTVGIGKGNRGTLSSQSEDMKPSRRNPYMWFMTYYRKKQLKGT